MADFPETCGGCGKERVIREVLDGDRLCQECCERWAREEADYDAYLRDEERALNEQLDAEDAAQ
jgi:hypothetical protein